MYIKNIALGSVLSEDLEICLGLDCPSTPNNKGCTPVCLEVIENFF